MDDTTKSGEFAKISAEEAERRRARVRTAIADNRIEWIPPSPKVDEICAAYIRGDIFIVSHAFCLGMPDPSLVDPLVAAIAGAGIAIMTTAPASRPVPSVRQLVRAGVVLCAGSDGIRDTWGRYGNGDMLERAMFVGLRNNLRRDDELAMALDAVTTGGAKALGLTEYGLTPGCGGDVVLMAAETMAQRPGARTVTEGDVEQASLSEPAFAPRSAR